MWNTLKYFSKKKKTLTPSFCWSWKVFPFNIEGQLCHTWLTTVSPLPLWNSDCIVFHYLLACEVLVVNLMGIPLFVTWLNILLSFLKIIILNSLFRYLSEFTRSFGGGHTFPCLFTLLYNYPDLCPFTHLYTHSGGVVSIVTDFSWVSSCPGRI